MARSGQTSHTRHPRHNTFSRSQCSDSNPSPTFSTTPLLQRPIPGLNVLTRDGLLPLPTSDQRLEATTIQPQGAHLHGQRHDNLPQQVITIPTHLNQASYRTLFGNRFVLAFEEEYDSWSTMNWPRTTQRPLIRAGFWYMADVTNRDGSMLTWEDGPSRLLSTRLRPAYQRLLSGLHRNPLLCTEHHLDYTVFLESHIPEQGSYVWEFCVPRLQLVDRWCRNENLNPPRRVFTVVHQNLVPVPPIPLPASAEISRVIICTFTTKEVTQRICIGHSTADLQSALQFRWRDDLEFFDTSTSHLRALPATQHWRFPELPSTDQRTWCTRCDLQQNEDIIHCIWGCPISREVWNWVSYVFCISVPLSDRSHLLQPIHMFVAVRFPLNLRIPQQLWDPLRAISAWHIWNARCKHFIEGTRSLSASIIHSIWARLGVYLRQAWYSHVHKIKAGQLNQTEALTRMIASFGDSSEVWEVHEEKLQIPPVPPRPP